MKKVVMSVSLLSLFIALTSSIVPKPLSEGINGPSYLPCGQATTYTSSTPGSWSVSVNGTGAPVQILSQSSNSITIKPNCYYPHPGCPSEPYNIDIEKGNTGTDLVLFVY